MKLPPFWKIKREVVRLAQQIKSAPQDLAMFVFGTRYYDLFLSKQRHQWQGQQPWSDRVAIFVIFPSDGLLGSHVDTLRHVSASGYAAVVVSNQPLTETDRAKVLDHCTVYIERPNFGYDFGAYRDGVLSVRDRMETLKRLVLLNDSAWYPLPGQKNWLREAERMGLDLVGAVSNYGTPRVDPADFREIRWSYSRAHRNFHYASFALSFGPAVLRDPAFVKFWKGLRLANKKKRVVRHGEIAISQWVLAHGYSNDCLYSPEHLDGHLHALSDDRLEDLARNIIIPEHISGGVLKSDLAAMRRSDPEWRKTLVQFILMSVSLQGAGYVLADLMINEHGFPFLKKSPLRLSKDGANATLRIISGLDGTGADRVLREARDIYDRRSDSPEERPEN